MKRVRYSIYNHFLMGNCQQGQVKIPHQVLNATVHPQALKNISSSQVPKVASPPQVSKNKVTPAVSKQTQNVIIISQESKDQAQILLSKYKIGRCISEMLDGQLNGLDGVAYSETQATDLAKALVQGVFRLQKLENIQNINTQKSAVQNLFNMENTQLIKQQKLFYYGMLQKLNKKPEQISQYIRSRIYHKIANIKKDIIVQKQWLNEHKIKCFTSNAYKILSDKQLDEVVRYEVIADSVKDMGEKINFKFESIKKQSDKILQVLQKVMIKHQQQIKGLLYDMNLNQVMKVAEISRDACNYYDNGVFLLLIYLVQSCKKLQNNGTSSKDIEKLLNDAIQNISKKYPPGEGFQKENLQVMQALKKLKFDITDQKLKFSHKPNALNPSDKQKQVENIILSYATTAEQCKQLFQLLIRQTCVQRAVIFKIGLKVYPKKPNKKAMTRIKEKMFFKKDVIFSKDMNGSINQILNREEINYGKIIDDILDKSTSVTFKISDMVRGKCVFLEISDIIETVNAIKDFANRNPQNFKIEQIQSRFNNTVPISDVTLKIVIKNMIVAELQLTIQTNAATYNFAHKIYELQRTKVFSKLKIVHNYFEESNEDFGQLSSKALSLLTSKSKISEQNINIIKKYFKLDSVKSQTFVHSLSKALELKKSEKQTLKNAVDPLIQDFMEGIFRMANGFWHKSLGKIINNVLKDQSLSVKLKSVLLSCFFDKFQLPKESEYMHQLGILEDQLKSKIFMEEFLREYFQIEKAYQYTAQNERLFQRAQQLKQIRFSKRMQNQPINLQSTRHAINFVIQQHCKWNIVKLREMFDFYFVTRREYRKIQDRFSYYYNWINHQLKSNQQVDQQGTLKSQIAIIKAQQLLQTSKPEQAKCILEEAKKVFANRQKHQQALYCDILLTQCFVKENNHTVEDCVKKNSKEVVEKAQTLGLQLKGALFADAMWRISQFIWNQGKINGDGKAILLKSFTKMALQQMSRSQGSQYIYALIKRWVQYQSRGWQKQCKIKENPKIKYMILNKIGDIGCQHLSKADWKNLNTLILYGNKIEAGCSHLIKANWKNLTTLNLNTNDIGASGCLHLIKGDWKSLSTLDLGFNQIGDVGCSHLIKADWKNLNTLNLESNKIEAKGSQHLIKANWKDLNTLSLKYNRIGAKGCQYLIKADWKNLSKLNLMENFIGEIGCEHLSKGDWKNLSRLDLYHNQIGDKGCQHLIKSNWKNINILTLDFNKIEAIGCQHLIKADWKNLIRLKLDGNKIGDKGCEHLIKANWKNLNSLQLCHGQIGANGYEHLSKGDWKNLRTLLLWGNQKSSSIRGKFTQKNLQISI